MLTLVVYSERSWSRLATQSDWILCPWCDLDILHNVKSNVKADVMLHSYVFSERESLMYSLPNRCIEERQLKYYEK